MVKTFTDIKALDPNAPFSIKSLKFLVILDDHGNYHLQDHSGIEDSACRYFSPRTAKTTLKRLADCCLKEKAYLENWETFDPKRVISARDYLLSSISSFMGYEPKSKLEAYHNLQALLNLSPGGHTLVQSFVVPGWEDEYGEILKSIKERLVSAFKSFEDESFLHYCASTAISYEMELVVSPKVKESLQEARRIAVNALVADERQFLVKLHSSPSAFRKVLLELYGAQGFASADLLIAPVAVVEYVNSHNLLQDKTRLLEPISAQTLEALNVLYRPEVSGPYSNLTKAYKASRVL